MREIKDRSNVQSAEEGAGARKFTKKLHLNKEVVRTLTGSEMQMVAGADPETTLCSEPCHTTTRTR